ncbi:MAG: AbiV family abortive infection protein [Candidatus Bathyarchaeia archaeon]
MKIPVNKLEEGANVARMNAWQFLEDAEHLLSRGSYGHAVALAMLAFEEYAKTGVFRAMKLDPPLRDDLSERIANRDHVSKFMVALRGVLSIRGQRPTPELNKRVLDIGGNLQSLKERGMYVNYYNGKWLTPQSDDMKNAAQHAISETRRLLEELESNWLR